MSEGISVGGFEDAGRIAVSGKPDFVFVTASVRWRVQDLEVPEESSGFGMETEGFAFSGKW
jgi:hypothetical protein